MDEQRQPKRHTQFSRATRSKRILDRLREGWAYDEVAREEALTERRVRQIVAEYLKDRDAVESVTHAHMQIDRLGWAMRVAAEAMGEGDVRAIGPFIKAIDRLDRYQALARRTGTQPNTLEEEDLAVVRALVARLQGAGAPGHAVSADAPKSGRASAGSAMGPGSDPSAEREAPQVSRLARSRFFPARSHRKPLLGWNPGSGLKRPESVRRRSTEIDALLGSARMAPGKKAVRDRATRERPRGAPG